MPFVLLDRDGVINEDSEDFIKSPGEWVALPGSLEAIARLTRAGFRVVVLTNQSGIARGLFDESALNQIHAKMSAEVGAAGGSIEAVFHCPHGPSDQCDCRKPRPGMFLRFARQFATSLIGVPAIGDSLRDIQAASAVNASPILVRTGKGEATLRQNPDLELPIVANLYEAATLLIDRPR